MASFRPYESIAFRYIAANEQPDHDSLCTFRKRFLKQIEALFVQVLGIARQMKLLKLGTIALDGTKIHANASRHSALSYGHAQKIEARAAERDACEKADVDAKMKARDEKATRTGRKPGGKPPAPPSPGVRPTDQINLTDADSRIMPGTGKGFEQSYNAQAAVDTESMLVVATDMAQVGHRQAAARADAGRACRLARGIGQREAVVDRQRVLSARRTSSVAWRRRSSRCLPRGAMDITRTGRTDSPSHHHWPSLPAMWTA